MKKILNLIVYCLTTSLLKACFHVCHFTSFNFLVAIHKAQSGWRRIAAQAALWGIPIPAMSTALAFFDGYRSEVVPANLLQAQVSKAP